jgi:hypothetical protein
VDLFKNSSPQVNSAKLLLCILCQRTNLVRLGNIAGLALRAKYQQQQQGGLSTMLRQASLLPCVATKHASGHSAKDLWLSALLCHVCKQAQPYSMCRQLHNKHVATASE